MSTQAEQNAAWNGTGGNAWVRLQPLLDETYAPIEELLVDRVAAVAGSGPIVLDVGCGTGATTLALARRLGPTARCVGVDLSEPMVELARTRAGDAAVEFVVADAGRHPFAPGGADVIASRFGVMFFDDPVAAFTNLRTATRAGGALRAIVWRPPAENPFMTRAGEAAAPLLDVPAFVPGAPGPFALADPDRALDLLREAGWSSATADPVDLACGFAERDLDDYVGTMGPVGRALAGEDTATRARVLEHVRPAFDEFRADGRVRFTAAVWLLAAEA